MRVSVLRTALLLSSVALTRESISQTPDRTDPNRLRPPTVVSTSAEASDLSTARLFMQELIRALQVADTIAVNSLVVESAISPEELNAASIRGCPSMNRAVDRIRFAAGRPRTFALSSIARDTTSTSRGDTTSVVVAEVRAVRPGDSMTLIRTRLVLLREAHARSIQGIDGILIGLCGLAP
jgi:hypothetical protein